MYVWRTVTSNGSMCYFICALNTLTIADYLCENKSPHVMLNVETASRPSVATDQDGWFFDID